MTLTTRSFVATCLALAVALTGHQAAVALGADRGVAEATICLGHTVVTVRIDADGQPVQTHHLCPDVALWLFSAETGDAPQAAHAPDYVALIWGRAEIGGGRFAVGAPRARGPPFSV